MQKNTTVAVLGSGNMGTALAQVIAGNGVKVNIWNHAGDIEPIEQIQQFKENIKYLPGIKLSDNLTAYKDLKEAVKNATVIFFATPSRFVAAMAKMAAPFAKKNIICVDSSKGVDEVSLGLVTDNIKNNMPVFLHAKIVTISGPAIAKDMVEGGFTAMNIASKDAKAIKAVQKIMQNDNLHLVPTTDFKGVEIAGSFKNVYAIAMGLCDGFALPMNTKAALLVVALKEMSVLIKKMGGQAGTVYDLAGLGDLIGTGFSPISRNRRFGECLASGLNVKDAITKIGQVVEGALAAQVLFKMSKKYKIKSVFADTIYKITTEQVAPRDGLFGFLKTIK